MDERISKRLKFLTADFPSLLFSIDVNQKAAWGKMNVQQMIEHMIDAVTIANGKKPEPAVTPEEKLPAMQDFLRSEKPFRPETKNALMPETPVATIFNSVPEAVAQLKTELKDFVKAFENHPDKQIQNAFFGMLNFNDWILLLYKHAIHHLKQFNVVVEEKDSAEERLNKI